LSVYLAYFIIRKKNAGKDNYLARGYPFNALLMIVISLGLIIGLFIEGPEKQPLFNRTFLQQAL